MRGRRAYLTAAMKADFTETGSISGPLSAGAARLKIVQDLVCARTARQRDADKRLFLNSLSDSADRADFERHGWMSALNAEAIRAFWAELSPEAFEASEM